MAIPNEKGDRLDIEVTFRVPKNGQDLADVSKAISYLADRTGVAPEEVTIDDHEYDEGLKVASWITEGLG